MKVQEMNDQEFRGFLSSQNLNELTMDQLKRTAKRLSIVGADAFRVSTKHELSELVFAAANAYLGFVVGEDLYESDSADYESEEPVGFLRDEHKVLCEPGVYRLTYVSDKGADGIFMAGLRFGAKKINVVLTDHAYVRSCKEKYRAMLRPTVEVDSAGSVFARAFVDTIPNDIVNLPEEDPIIKVMQYGLTPDGEIPDRDKDDRVPEGYRLDVPVKVIRLIPVYNEENKIVSVNPVWAMELHPVNTPMMPAILDGRCIPIVFNSNINDENHATYVMFSRRAVKDVTHEGGFPREKKLLFGDPKKPIVYSATRAVWEDMFGQKLFDERTGKFDKNPHKTWKACVGTPRDFRTVGATRTHFRMRLVEEQYIKFPSMGGDDVLGYKIHDGVCHTNGWKFRFLSKKNVRNNRGWKWANCTAQVRTFPGEAIKGTFFGNVDEYKIECKHHGYQPEEQDGIATMDILKTQRDKYKPGDILLIPIQNLQVIKLKMSDWSSSIGTQSIRLDPQSVRQLYHETGAIDRAELLKAAMSGRLEDVFDLLAYGGKADSWQDSRTLGAKLALFSEYEPSMGDYRACMYTPNRSVLNARGMAFYREHLLKNKVMQLGLYLQGSRRMDMLEERTHQKKLHELYAQRKPTVPYEQWSVADKEALAVPFEYFAMLPKIHAFTELIAADSNINIGRNPLAGPGNVMGFTACRDRNTSHDAILISSRAMATMYADQDGDTLLVCPSQHTKFPTYVVPPIMKEEKEAGDPVDVSSIENYLEKVVLPITYQAFKSASDIGILDNLTRRIIFERWWAGMPLTPAQLLEMGRMVEDAIAGLKHSGRGAQEDASTFIIRKFGVPDKNGVGTVKRVSASSLDYLITREDQGVRAFRGSPAKQMERLAQNLTTVEFHPNNPFNTTLSKLVGLDVLPIHADSLRIKQRCADEWAATIARLKAGAYPWKSSDITTLGGNISVRYNADSQNIMKLYGDEKDKDMRREEFSRLYKFYRQLIIDQAINRFGSADIDIAVKWQRQLMFYVGMISFGMRRDGQSSLGGSCFWCFDMHKCLIWLARRWNKVVGEEGGYRNPSYPPNHYIDSVEAAYIEAERKEAERKEKAALTHG